MSVDSRSAEADRFFRHIRFDEWAPRYDASPFQLLLFGPTHDAVLRAAVDAGAQPETVLDLGCGTGRLLARAASTWPRANLIGVDPAAAMIERGKRVAGNDARYRFEIGDAAAIPLDDHSVDVAFTTISFHHWADQRGGLREAFRVLRAGGLFILADLHPPLLLRPLMRAFHASAARERMFRDVGFTVVDERRPLRMGRNVLVTVARKP